jgi:hypothetical protein
VTHISRTKHLIDTPEVKVEFYRDDDDGDELATVFCLSSSDCFFLSVRN